MKLHMKSNVVASTEDYRIVRHVVAMSSRIAEILLQPLDVSCRQFDRLCEF